MADDAKMMTKHHSFLWGVTQISQVTSTAKSRPGGAVSYSAKYRRIYTGYKGALRVRLFSSACPAADKGDCILRPRGA